MQPFKYRREENTAAAVAAIGQMDHGKFLAGGTNLIDLMKNGVELPAALVDINRLPLTKIETLPDGGVRLGALARNSDTANHPLVRERYPLVSYAILSGASPQLRNLATNGETFCSARAVLISWTRDLRSATSVFRAAVAARLRDSIACMRSSEPANSALRPIRPICAWHWRLSRRKSWSWARRVNGSYR